MTVNATFLNLTLSQQQVKSKNDSEDEVLGANGVVARTLALANQEANEKTTKAEKAVKNEETKNAVIAYIKENASTNETQKEEVKTALSLNSEGEKSIIRIIGDAISGAGSVSKLIGKLAECTKLVKAGPIAAAISAIVKCFDFIGMNKEEKETEKIIEGNDETKKNENAFFHPWNTIKTLINKGIEKLEKTGNKALATTIKVLKHAGEAVATFVDGFIFGDTIRGTYNSIKDMITGNMAKKDAEFKKQAENCKTIGEAVEIGIKHPWDSVKLGINMGIENLSKSKSVLAKVGKYALIGVKYVGEVVASAVSATVGGIARKAVDVVKTVASKVIDGTKYVAGKVVDAAKKVGSVIASTAKTVISKVGGFFRSLFHF